MSLFIILLLSGCALLGGLAVFFVKKDSNQRLKLILSFSGAYLFAITILHLLPDVYQRDQTHLIGLFILGGFILQILLEQFSQGIEHGHIHLHSHQQSFPWGIMLSLCLHAFLEGMPLTAKNNQQLVYGIALHHIPAAFALGSVLIGNQIKKTNIILLLVAFAAMSPLGYIFSFALSNGNIQSLGSYYPYIMGVVIGIFLHISTTILFESSVDHKFSMKKTFAVLVGIAIALIGFFLEA
ncbi:MAG: ZIP family metal transporter [Bacteroidetes bacterium]|nr:ZIP family metal transporter [Bacteroidota bacterium]MBU1373825.1 ZIP family metal transporter [Bacteroidota bacterium]MBU1483931.1 ZIP family metal transporter [Bacteroidota bacterium]MBU1761484.1 ZIP family metal transporter [Bacteroidota bacterium]MBU2045993.1 ZIP family metal transporter [Bacteroidota bacterium]